VAGERFDRTLAVGLHGAQDHLHVRERRLLRFERRARSIVVEQSSVRGALSISATPADRLKASCAACVSATPTARTKSARHASTAWNPRCPSSRGARIPPTTPREGAIPTWRKTINPRSVAAIRRRTYVCVYLTLTSVGRPSLWK
jgi:hypothetical protein